MMESGSASLLTDAAPAASNDDSTMFASFMASSPGTTASPSRETAGPTGQAPSQSGAQNDLALLAWLANHSDGNQSGSDESLADDDRSGWRLNDEPESVDVAFELLEGNALASATI